jgi:hypothetical protein
VIASIGWPISCGSRWPRSAPRARRRTDAARTSSTTCSPARSAVSPRATCAATSTPTRSRTLWSFTIGNRIPSVALDQDIFAGLASVWELLLRAIATPESEPYFQQFAARMAQQHSSRRALSG